MNNYKENKNIFEAYEQIKKCKYMKPLTEASLQHIINKKYSGYFILSACRSDWVEYELDKLGITTEEEFREKFHGTKMEYLNPKYWNNLRSKELENDLKSLGFGYIPVYGGFKETSNEKPDGITVYERSYFVPFDGDGEEAFNEVKEKIIELGKKYRQESVTICPPGEAPYFYVTTKYPNGDDVGTEQRYFGKDYKINDVAQQFFTANNKSDRWNDGDFSKKPPRRFSFESTNESVMVGGDPMSYAEAYSRNMKGEIFAPPYPCAKMIVI